MKKLYFLLFFAFSFIANAQYVNIPDPIFKNYLVSVYDINFNGEIDLSADESQYIGSIDISNLAVTDVTGIESFNNLSSFNANNTNLNYVDLTNNTQLTNINCSDNINLSYLNLSNLTNLITAYVENNSSLGNGFVYFNNSNLNNLYIGSSNIYTLDLNQFPSLVQLWCFNNNISTLDFSNCPNIERIYASENQLSTINFGTITSIKKMYLGDNNLNSINLSSLALLENLDFALNNINSIDLSLNINLLSINCNSNNLTNLDLSSLTYLNYLECSNNQLTNLDVSNNFALTDLVCNDNQLSSIDVSENTLLANLNIENNLNLNYIFAKNGIMTAFPPSPPGPIGIGGLMFTGCDNLYYICVTDTYVQDVNDYIEGHNTFFGSFPNPINVNSYCSFNPGETFYKISGNTKFDFNNNGCDVADINFPNLKISITDGTNSGTMIADTTGDYYIPVQAGSHTVTPVLESPSYFNISPTSFTVDFPVDTSPFTQDFCVTANGVHSDVEVFFMPITSARPGFDAVYKIVYRNKGNLVENGSVSLAFDDAVLDYVTSNPIYDSNATNSFTWNYTNLQPFETREIEISFNVNSPTETPAINIDDILNYTATITTANTDETPDDNTFDLNQTVVGSYDPNDKTCLEGEYVSSNVVGKYVHYVIRFENTGTYPAENIVVKDMIDISKFDISTLVPLHGSHEFYTRIKDNKVEFIFENINLDFNDATNDGYVAFKIKTLPTLNIGDSFSNNANIYFDYNFPITTNTYNTTINNVLNNQDFVFENEFVLYPNPANEIINISTKNQTEINSVEIYNLVGQIVLAIPNTTNKIDVSNLETGTYFIKVNTEKGSTTTKFVKE